MSQNDWLIFVVIQMAMIACAFWEAYIEGPEGWAAHQVGWKIKFGSFTYTAYHFWLYWVMIPLLLALPLVADGWDAHLFWVLVFAYTIGATIEDFMWFVVNPVYPLKKFNRHKTAWHSWVKIVKVDIPTSYIIRAIVSIVIYWFFLR